jgi:hypothetical protein
MLIGVNAVPDVGYSDLAVLAERLEYGGLCVGTTP